MAAGGVTWRIGVAELEGGLKKVPVEGSESGVEKRGVSWVGGQGQPMVMIICQVTWSDTQRQGGHGEHLDKGKQ